MPVDDRDEPKSPGQKADQQEIKAALQSETDAPLPPAAERIAERDADQSAPRTPQGWRRKYVTRRNAAIAAAAIVVIAGALILIAFMLYRMGYVDRYVASQIKDTLATYGIHADIKDFHLAFSPRTVELKGIELSDAQTGEQLGKVDRILATVRVEDLYALNLRRNVNLESLVIDGVELWVKFDRQGRSNFSNLHLPPPEPNKRILFSYSTAQIKLNSSVVHYGDQRYDISGEARNINATIQPDNPNAPADSWMNSVTLSSTNSTFTYNGQTVQNIDVNARARVNQTSAEIQELTLRSPVMEAHLSGTMDDWRNLNYKMQVNSQVDLTQASDILQSGTALRGVANFNGTVTGQGDKYQIQGQGTSDALAADNVRLRNLNINASGSGQGKSYDVNGRVLADLLTAGDFQLNMVQLTGRVMGTGTDFSWVGDLRSAAARYQDTTIAGLMLSDARAEMQGDVITANVGRANAGRVNSSGMTLTGAQVSDVRVRNEKGATAATIGNLQAGTLTSSGARVNGLAASNVEITDRDGTTNVTTGALRVNGIDAAGAKIGALNIAGVRLAIRGKRIEGTTNDFNVGTVALEKTKDFAGGKLEDVRVAHPVFTVEPAGRYRASADLSLGGGVLGTVKIGAARAAVVASNTQIELNNFNADLLGGRAAGNAVVSTAKNGSSRVRADFSGLDLNLLAALSGRVVPINGKATGSANLTFPGTDLTAASGNVNATFSGETGDEVNGRTPLNGEVALNATRGLFEIQRANLKTAASELTATGQFSFVNEDSNLQVNLNSTDASELQNVLVSSGLLPDVEEQLNNYGIQLAGNLNFAGSVRGNLKNPSVEGRASVGSIALNGRDLGALSANLNLTPAQLNVTNGQLTERDGGGAQFTLNAPRTGENNMTVKATLDRFNAGTLLALIPADKRGNLKPEDLQSDLSGDINVSGLMNAMTGSANLRFGAGRIGNEPFESITANATFAGSKINIENVDAHLNAGRVTAKGTYDTTTQAFDLQAQGTAIQLDRLRQFAKNPATLPRMTGTADLTAHATGIFTDFSTYDINFNGTGHDVTINGRAAGELSLVGTTENKQLSVKFTTGLLGQPQVVTARVDLGNERLPTTIETTLTGADLTPLFAALLPQANVKVTGHATGALRIAGDLVTENKEGETGFSLAGLHGTANFTDLTVQIEDVQLSAVSPLLVQFQSNEIYFEKTQFTGPGTNVTFGGRVAIGPGGQQTATVDGSINLRVLNGLSPNIFVSGAAEVHVAAGGSYEDPRLSGTASIAGGSLAALVGTQNLQLSNVKGTVRFNADQAQIESLTGNLGGGRVNASGGMLLTGLNPFTFSLRGDDVTVPYPEGFRSTANADIEIRGTRREQFITGTVNLRRSEYTENIELADFINQRREAALTEGSAETPFAATAQLDLTVEGRDALVVRNNLGDLVGSVSLRISGPVEDPVVSGRISATRGTFVFRDQRYEIARAFIDLPAQREADPILNIQGEAEIRGYNVIVSLTGPLSQPNATVRSEPSLPQADVVALILTGNLATDEGGNIFSQPGVGAAASVVADAIINSPIRRATDKLFGLNRFEIDPLISGRGGASPTARLTVGRQINKNLSITYSTNLTADQNQVLAVEYRVSNRLAFIAQYEQGSVRGFQSRNDNFSFEIRFRKRF